MQSDITMCFGKLNKRNIYDKTLNLSDYFKQRGLDNVHINWTQTQTPKHAKYTQNTSTQSSKGISLQAAVAGHAGAPSQNSFPTHTGVTPFYLPWVDSCCRNFIYNRNK